MNSRDALGHDTDDQVKLVYCCPTHGKFGVIVPRSAVPDIVECRHWTPGRGIFRGGECRALSSQSSGGLGVVREEPCGHTDDQIKHAYCCPTHGRFEVFVSRNRIPDAVECRHWTPGRGIFRGGECRVLSSHESSGDPGVTSIEGVSRG